MMLRTLVEGANLHRDDKLVSVRFTQPFNVLSTCRAHGGFRDDLTMIHNSQGCEPKNHMHNMDKLIQIHRYPEEQHNMLLGHYGLDEQKSAGLGTAANMNNLCISSHSYRDITVVAAATGGCESNAARAGDPASYYEYNGTHEKRTDLAPGEGRQDPEKPGTINTIIVVNTPMEPGAMVRAVMTATEAKAAVLQEANAPSFQSQSLATGTGTDQIAIAAPQSGAKPLSSAGHHCVLGELIGKAVHDAIAETLSYQNMLRPDQQCSCSQMLKRYGCTIEKLKVAVQNYVSGGLKETVANNHMVIDRDPLTVSAVASLVHIHDQYKWGTLPSAAYAEAAVNLAAMIAVNASGRVQDFQRYRAVLDAAECAANAHTAEGIQDLVFRSIALGYLDKWQATADMLANAMKKLEAKLKKTA